MTEVVVDSKNVIVITKQWMAVFMTVCTFGIGMAGYIWNSQVATVKQHTHAIRELEARSYSTLDLIERLHPNDNVPDLYDRAMLRYYSRQVRGAKSE
jgi:hypothetical protein